MQRVTRGLQATALLASLLLHAAPVRAATDPAAPGPFAAGRRTQGIPATQGATLQVDIHYPDAGGAVDPAAGACPLLVFGHGFSSNRGAHVNQGAHWASRGYVVLVPDFQGFADHSRNADDMVALVDWALARNADPASWLFGTIDGSAIGVSGHSAGGLSSIVAAARDPRVGAVAPMDPVDNGGLGEGLIGSIDAPVAITFSEDSSCNANGSARALYAAASPIRRGVKIVGANHCDPLDPSNFGCAIVCGAASAARQEQYRRLVTGWFEYWLRCDESYFEWAYGARIQADVASGALSYEADPDPGPLPCVAVTPPPEVQGLRAARDGLDVLLRWEAVPPPVYEYRIFRAGVVPFPAVPPRATTPVASGADPGAVDGAALWFYQVRAANAAGEGP